MFAIDGAEAASIALPALIEASLAGGLALPAFLSREALLRETASLPESLRRKFDLEESRGALLALLPFGQGPTEPPAWAAEPLPLASLGRFVRSNWYAELAFRLKAAAAAARAALAAAGIEPGRARDWRYLVNSGLPERPLALAAGLGYRGRNGLLLAGEWGPGVLIGLLLLPFDPALARAEGREPGQGSPAPGGFVQEAPRSEALRPGGLCGSCRACAEACPTGAIRAEGGIRRELCLQHWSALPGSLPPAIEAAWGNLLYGCDICTDACPRCHPALGKKTDFGPLGPGLSAQRLLELSESELRLRLKGSALGLGWISLPALKRNAALALRRSRR